MLCEMHSGEPYGHLTTSTGVPIKTAAALARLVGESTANVSKWLTELEAAQVFSRTETGVIFSRRMVRDAAGRDAWRGRQMRHRSPDDRSDVTPVSRLRHADVTPVSRDRHAVNGNGNGKGKESPDGDSQESLSSDSAKTKASALAKKVRPVPEPPQPFDAKTEASVVAFLAVVASKNRTGTITAGREQTIRRELHAALSVVGIEALQHGLHVTAGKEIENPRYAISVARSYAEKNPPLLFGDEPERELESLDLPYDPTIAGANDAT